MTPSIKWLFDIQCPGAVETKIGCRKSVIMIILISGTPSPAGHYIESVYVDLIDDYACVFVRLIYLFCQCYFYTNWVQQGQLHAERKLVLQPVRELVFSVNAQNTPRVTI